MKTNHKIINSDSRAMSEVRNNSVNLIITSPPYWQLKDYGTDNQIGFNDSYENYINNLVSTKAKPASQTTIPQSGITTQEVEENDEE